ncbi:MAG: TetR-like C-terminal domain-containing protein [Selenomonadaceae bacterium]
MRLKLNMQRIIEAAAAIADEQGFDAVTLTTIAEKFGIKKPSLYNHINNLGQLRCELVIFASMHLKEKLAVAAIGKSKKNAILEIAVVYRQFAHEHPGQYQAIMSSSWEYKENQKFKTATRELMGILRMVLSHYDLHDDDLTHAVRGLRSIMHGFVSLEASGWFTKPAGREESYLQLIQTFISGVEIREHTDPVKK